METCEEWNNLGTAASPESQFGSYNLNFTILNEAPPHGIEIAIRHDLGYYIRYKKDESVATNGVITSPKP